MPKLDSEEREIVESYERDHWRPVAESAVELERYRQYARETFKKDLESIQKRALEEGIPYQTLIASVLHKYLNGRLTERSS